MPGTKAGELATSLALIRRKWKSGQWDGWVAALAITDVINEHSQRCRLGRRKIFHSI